MKKRFRRESLICRADGDSGIYETSHRERLKVLKENHENHFSAMAIGFSVPKEKLNRYTVTFLGEQMVLSNDEYNMKIDICIYLLP